MSDAPSTPEPIPSSSPPRATQTPRSDAPQSTERRPHKLSPIVTFITSLASQPSRIIKPFYAPPHKKPRHYGLQPPHDALQVIAWILFSCFLIAFTILCLPAMNEWVALPTGVIFITLCLTWYSTNLFLGISNSRDRRSKVKKSFYDRNHAENQDLNWCRHCESFVHQSSKHCRLCDKCVENFDHHCRWLNTCIGRKNYIVFLIFVTNTLFVLQFAVLVKVYLIFSFIFEYSANAERVSNIYFVFPHYVLFGLQMLLGILEVIAIIPVLQLWLFHIKLILRRQTTYEFIIEKRILKDEYEAAVSAGDFPPPTKKWKRLVLLLFCLCPVLISDNRRWRRFRKFQKRREREINQWTATRGAARGSGDYGRSMRYRGEAGATNRNEEQLDEERGITHTHHFTDADTDHEEVTYRGSQTNDVASTLYHITSNDSLTTLQSEFSESRRERAHTTSARFSRSSINKVKPLDLRSSSASFITTGIPSGRPSSTSCSGKKRSNSLRDSNYLSSRSLAENVTPATMLSVQKEKYGNGENGAADGKSTSTPSTPVLRGTLVSAASPEEHPGTLPTSQQNAQPPSEQAASTIPQSPLTSTIPATSSNKDQRPSSDTYSTKSRKRSTSIFTPLSGTEPSPKINRSLDTLHRKEMFKRSGSFRKYSQNDIVTRASTAPRVPPQHRHSVQLSPRRFFPSTVQPSHPPSTSQSVSSVEALHSISQARRRASAFATLCIADEIEFERDVYDSVNSPSNVPHRLRPSSAKDNDSRGTLTPDSPTGNPRDSENMSNVSIHLIEEQMPVMIEESPLTMVYSEQRGGGDQRDIQDNRK